MKIQNINNTNYISYNKKPNFKSWDREVSKEIKHIEYVKDFMSGFDIPVVKTLKKVIHRNDTFFYRGGVFWNNLAEFLVDKYKDTPKINVYDYACSNGSEVLTFAMSLLSKFDEKSTNKFFPILAKDYDKVAIESAQKNFYPITSNELANINDLTNKQFFRFFHEGQKFDIWGNGYYPAKKELTEKILFSVADVLEDYKKIKPNDSIIFVRNFWPYLQNNDQINLANNLYRQIEKNSTIVIGKYDQMEPRVTHRADNLLRDVGFKLAINPELSGLVFEK